MTVADGILVRLVWVSLLAYLLAFGLLLARRLRRVGLLLFALSWFLNVSLVLANGYRVGHPPFGSMYNVLLFLGCCFWPLYTLLARRHNLGWTAVYFVFSSAVALVGTLVLDAEAFWHRTPALQSPWFVPHVTSYVISYAFAIVAFALAAVDFVRRRYLGQEIGPEYEEAQHRVLLFAFPLMTFGMLSGAIWADQVWAACWSWDPKETWSLITWTLYLIYLHCRRSPAYRRYAGVTHALAFAALLITFVLVNLLPKMAGVLHRYA